MAYGNSRDKVEAKVPLTKVIIKAYQNSGGDRGIEGKLFEYELSDSDTLAAITEAIAHLELARKKYETTKGMKDPGTDNRERG